MNVRFSCCKARFDYFSVRGFVHLRLLKQKGADAVLIRDYFVPNDATDLHTVLRTDSAGKATVSIGNTRMERTSEQKITVFFPRYKE